MEKRFKLPNVTIGILGGGQLARMTVEAANRLGFQVAILENSEDSPAGKIATFEIVGPWSDTNLLDTLAQTCDVVTLENEFVDCDVLQYLEAKGVPVYPSALTLRLIQDKARQKQVLRSNSIPVPAFATVENEDDVLAFAREYGWPLILKARRNGYDGKGNWKLDSTADIQEGFENLTRGGSALMVEAFVPFERELAVMVVRRSNGEIITYPVVETIQKDHICHTVTAPAAVSAEVTRRAEQIARGAIEAIQGVGVFGVEMFQAGGEVLINELAPRPHNSGHYTIEACPSSQFDNLLRAILDLPLGSTELIAPAAMVNLLGQNKRTDGPDGLEQALAVPGANVHLYGKAESRPGRKMGHVTALAPGSNTTKALEIARQAANKIIF
ncbi:MAG TPA: 5-(carboxyamino)imidazole ribonucleotide synthase [Chloroflexia bacterium]|nr:5-(carboxyamino)imidazole ribonucleotide synthase [Chloroflexia bacterium]